MPNSPESSDLELGDKLRDQALASPIAASRFQQLDRALNYYKTAEAANPGDPGIALRRVAIRFLSAGKSGEMLASAQAEASLLLAATLGAEGFDSIHARAVSKLVSGDTAKALSEYGRLQKSGDQEIARLAEVRYLARHMARSAGLSPDFFDQAFPPLRLVVFSGHLPPRVDEECRELIEKELGSLDACIGVASAAAGADLLFLDALHARGGVSHIILPWSREAFRETSILPFGEDAVWNGLFDEALEKSGSLREIGEIAGPDSPVAWQYLLEISAGIAKHIAAEMHLDIVPLALWDGKPGSPGGTAAFCQFWKEQLRIEPRVIALPTKKVSPVAPRLSAAVGQRSQSNILQQSVKSMLFIDVVGFSALPEASIPTFLGSFLNGVSEVVAASSHAPHSINTWGDAMYAVFDFVQDAGRFALELNEMVENRADEWEAHGLGKLQIRTGLHAGPVFLHHDPIVRRLGFSGAHVNRAARIEPTALPGEILASEEFAALAAISPAAGFTLEYSATRKLVKDYPGEYRLYRLTRDRSADLLLLARSIHEDYCLKAREYGDTPKTNSALVPWDELTPGLQSANLAQAEDIPDKLRSLGYEIADSGGIRPLEMTLDPSLVEPLAREEHDRWMADKMRAGWTFAPVRDNAKLLHPLLVPYDDLPDSEMEKDRATVRNIPVLLAKAGYRVISV